MWQVSCAACRLRSDCWRLPVPLIGNDGIGSSKYWSGGSTLVTYYIKINNGVRTNFNIDSFSRKATTLTTTTPEIGVQHGNRMQLIAFTAAQGNRADDADAQPGSNTYKQ